MSDSFSLADLEAIVAARASADAGASYTRSLLDKGASGVKVFLMGDAAACAHGGQKVPQGYYNIADMLGGVLRRGGAVSVCGSCMDARGITADELVAGAERGSMDVLSAWTADADKVIVF